MVAFRQSHRLPSGGPERDEPAGPESHGTGGHHHRRQRRPRGPSVAAGFAPRGVAAAVSSAGGVVHKAFVLSVVTPPAALAASAGEPADPSVDVASPVDRKSTRLNS